jgi:hypothetical protein
LRSGRPGGGVLRGLPALQGGRRPAVLEPLLPPLEPAAATIRTHLVTAG